MTNDNGGGKGRKRKYLPHGRPVKKKGSYPLHPGVQGFFITCDGGRERQASREAVSILESYYEELVHGKEPNGAPLSPPKRVNKVTKFKDSDSSSDEDEEEFNIGLDVGVSNVEGSSVCPGVAEANNEKIAAEESAAQIAESNVEGNEEQALKKQRIDELSQIKENGSHMSNDKPIDELIDDELKELSDVRKRLFINLDSGCNGVIFVQMHKRSGDPSPFDIVRQIMCSAKSTSRHMSRFILRFLPVEVSCYASEDEIAKAIKPLIQQYFPEESTSASKFAVLYEARSNTGIDRTKIINAVAKSVPQPHKVDLSNPDKSITVQIVKTICLIGVIDKYKEFAKYNLRELTSQKS